MQNIVLFVFVFNSLVVSVILVFIWGCSRLFFLKIIYDFLSKSHFFGKLD